MNLKKNEKGKFAFFGDPKSDSKNYVVVPAVKVQSVKEVVVSRNTAKVKKLDRAVSKESNSKPKDSFKSFFSSQQPAKKSPTVTVVKREKTIESKTVIIPAIKPVVKPANKASPKTSVTHSTTSSIRGKISSENKGDKSRNPAKIERIDRPITVLTTEKDDRIQETDKIEKTSRAVNERKKSGFWSFVSSDTKPVQEADKVEGSIFSNIRTKLVLSSSLLIALALVVGSVAASNYTIGYEVYVDNKNIGTVANKDEFTDALNEVKLDLAECIADGVVVNKNPEFNQTVITKDSLTDMAQVKQNLLNTVDGVIDAYTIVVDSQPVATLINEKDALGVLDDLKKPYKEKDGVISTEFDKEINITKEFVPVNKISTAESALAYLAGNVQEEKVHVVQKGENWWTIAHKYNMTMEALRELNSEAPDIIQIDQKLKISVATPRIGVKTVANVTIDRTIPFTTTKVDDDTLDVGKTEVSQQGSNGNKRIEAQITTINDVEISNEILSEKLVVSPIEQVEKIGTKVPETPKPEESADESERNPTAKSPNSSKSNSEKSSGTSASSGNFIRPAEGTFTSRYGYRGKEFHTGLDIANSTGTSVKAADSGTVVSAGWQGNYGYCVVIDHGNGYQTLYAHNSKLHVSAGDKVSKGQKIASMGSTGRSTGPHCHFEIKKNGQTVNPANYI